MDMRLAELRHALHRAPELSGNENSTAEILKNCLTGFKPDQLVTQLGGAGLLAVYRGIEPGRTVLLRCETDAVPVHEDISIPYRSIFPGVSHKCGHDGHMTVMAGVAGMLHRNPLKKGTVLLLFQPGEEDGTGAALVMEDRKFSGFQPDIVFAMHNLPGFPAGCVVSTSGPFAGASKGLTVHLKGKSSHAGEPLKGISPAASVAELIQGFEELCSHEDGVLITLIHAVIGEISFGTSPESAMVMATLRAPSEQLINELTSRALKLIEKTAGAAGLKVRTGWTDEFPATVNSKEADSIIRDSAESLGLNVISLNQPFPWSEDFGHLTGRFGGALFGLGAGQDSPPLHNPSYDFPDRLIDIGVSLYTRIIEEALKRIPPGDFSGRR